MELHEAVVCLAHWRKRTEYAQAKVRAILDAAMESPEYKAAAAESLHAHQMMSETEDAVRRLARAQYEATENGAVHDAVFVELCSTPNDFMVDGVLDVHIASDLSEYL